MSTRKLNTKKAFLVGIVAVVISVTMVITTQNSPTHITIDGLLENWGPQDMANRTKYVIIGTVKDQIVTSVDADPHRFNKPMVYTDVIINVERDLANQYKDNQITVRTLGGKTDKYWVESFTSPKFEMGEKVLIFVSKEPGSEMDDNYFVLGNIFGKYKLDNEKAYGKDHENGVDLAQLIREINSVRPEFAQNNKNPN